MEEKTAIFYTPNKLFTLLINRARHLKWLWIISREDEVFIWSW
jgi:hypothetical protein